MKKKLNSEDDKRISKHFVHSKVRRFYRLNKNPDVKVFFRVIDSSAVKEYLEIIKSPEVEAFLETLKEVTVNQKTKEELVMRTTTCLQCGINGINIPGNVECGNCVSSDTARIMVPNNET